MYCISMYLDWGLIRSRYIVLTQRYNVSYKVQLGPSWQAKAAELVDKTILLINYKTLIKDP